MNSDKIQKQDMQLDIETRNALSLQANFKLYTQELTSKNITATFFLCTA